MRIEINLQNLSDEQIVMACVNATRHQDLLEACPHRLLPGDVAIIYKYLLQEDEDGGMHFAIINNHLAEQKERTESELHSIAVANTPKLLPMVSFEFLDTLPVVSSQNGVCGAYALAIPSLFKELANKFDSDLCIIPSSIHELICIPLAWGVDRDFVLDMVRTSNATPDVIKPEDILSDTAYIYSRCSNSIRVF